VDLVRILDGATVRIRIGGYRLEGRVSFYGCWPKFQDGTIYSGGKRAEITCGTSREPSKLAKEIQRRLLPDYDRSYAQALAYVRTHDANGSEAEAIATRIAAAIGGKVGANRSRRGDGVAILEEPDAVRKLTVQPAYSGCGHERPVSVSFEVHDLDPETAVEALQLIQNAEQRRVETRARVAADPELLDVLDALYDEGAASESE
jgi:hypothetical protein